MLISTEHFLTLQMCHLIILPTIVAYWYNNELIILQSKVQILQMASEVTKIMQHSSTLLILNNGIIKLNKKYTTADLNIVDFHYAVLTLQMCHQF
jgi:hypothetical protein